MFAGQRARQYSATCSEISNSSESSVVNRMLSSEGGRSFLSVMLTIRETSDPARPRDRSVCSSYRRRISHGYSIAYSRDIRSKKSGEWARVAYFNTNWSLLAEHFGAPFRHGFSGAFDSDWAVE